MDDLKKNDAISINDYQRIIVRLHVMRYVFAKSFIRPGDRVLDIASGTGYGTHYLSEHLKTGQIIGVDIDSSVVDLAKKNYGSRNVDYLVGDAYKIPLEDDSIDVVISFETIEHVSDPDRFMAEVQRVLKPEGLFICSTPDIRNSFHPDFHLHEFEEEEFFSLLSKRFFVTNQYFQFENPFARLSEIITSKLGKLKIKTRFPIVFKSAKFLARSPKLILSKLGFFKELKKTDHKNNDHKILRNNIYFKSEEPKRVNQFLGTKRHFVAVCKGKKIL